jgi:hypothetical protein
VYHGFSSAATAFIMVYIPLATGLSILFTVSRKINVRICGVAGEPMAMAKFYFTITNQQGRAQGVGGFPAAAPQTTEN